MPHEIKHTFFCDICGLQYPPEQSRFAAPSFVCAIYGPHGVDPYDKTLPVGFNFIEGKLVCYKHTIQVSHNGDFVTLRKGEGDGEEVHQ